jgi:hypothetical protein
MFSDITRSQMLRAYPARFIRAFGHARVWLLLDATEEPCQISSMKTGHATMYSEYKGKDTIKFFAGCDPIGCTHVGSLFEDGAAGACTDSVGTDNFNMLLKVPFGHAVEVDKGFLIDNLCAMLGIGCVRPQKKLKKQVQQSVEDTGLCQKVGNTRIVVEQVNGNAKMTGGYFKNTIPLVQLDLAPILMRICFLMQNFHPALIHGQSMVGDDQMRKERPCRAEIRWYGATDDGLVDIRPHIEWWGTVTEKRRFSELLAEHSTTTCTPPDKEKLTKIAEIVLAEDWPTQLRAKHQEHVGPD